MKKYPTVKCLFVDIGGVMLTDGWNHAARRKAATHFHLDLADLEQRHHHAFDTLEIDKLTFDEYLDHVIFHEKRAFSRTTFRKYMFSCSRPFPQMIDLVRGLKSTYRLKVFVLSNEARELNAYRIKTFKLDTFVDAFISSCYVHLRKPDRDIFRLALDIAQTPPSQVVYIENTRMFVTIAEGLGVRSILHTDYASTKAALAAFGLAAR
jgi:putative hydrolase of the HAD superfamily